jgi:hypothetical protein
MSESPISVKLKREIITQARGCCEYCRSQVKFSPDPFSVEHIIPRAKGGTSKANNLALACQGCNNRKYIHTEARDPVTGELAPIYHPRRQRWIEHFTLNSDLTLVIGLTPTGRATVERLQLNREGVVNLRALLAAIDKHPPQTQTD